MLEQLSLVTYLTSEVKLFGELPVAGTGGQTCRRYRSVHRRATSGPGIISDMRFDSFSEE